MSFLRTKSRSWLEMNPIVAAVMIAVGLLAAGAVTLMIVPMINKTKDQQVMENLAAVKSAINTFMVNSNGEAPCFTSQLWEGSTQAQTTGTLCEQAGTAYNYEQGVTGAGADLDRDGKTGEAMTPFSMLVPKYLDKMPAPAYTGEPFIYTKGVNSDNNTTPAFAVSGLLHSDVADENVKKNISILDAISQSSLNSGTDKFTDTTTVKACRATDLQGSGKFGGTRSINGLQPAAGLGGPELGGWKYYAVTSLNATSMKAVVGTKNCDIYSDGNIFQNAFWMDDGESPSITMNETN